MFNSSHRNLNILVDKLLDISRESGFSTDNIIKHAKIDLSKPIQEVELPRIIDYVYNYTKDESLMVKLGQRVDVTYFGSFGFALMSCSDFTEAIKLVNRYQLLLGSGINFTVLSDSWEMSCLLIMLSLLFIIWFHYQKKKKNKKCKFFPLFYTFFLNTSPTPQDGSLSRIPSSS